MFVSIGYISLNTKTFKPYFNVNLNGHRPTEFWRQTFPPPPCPFLNTTMGTKRRKYSTNDLNAAVARVVNGESPLHVSTSTTIPYSTLRKWTKRQRDGDVEAPKRRGPPPLLPADAEQSIAEWVCERQRVGRPVDRQAILRKACEISDFLCNVTVGAGWYTRFMARFPFLAPRKAQKLSKTRNSVVETDVMDLFNTLVKLTIELKLQPSQIFNMDETAFMTRSKSKHVIAVRGSSNVWESEATASFHLTIVACASAAGLVIPPLFILPGQRVRMDLLSECRVPGASVTTTVSGFINGDVFSAWLPFFAGSVPLDVPRPLVLVLDGCSSHFSSQIHAVAAAVHVLLVILPSNATHLLQPLDVAVFASMKRKIRRLVDIFAEETDDGFFSIDKQTAVKVACMAWKSCRFSRNIVSGFSSCGICPPSLVNMQRRLDVFKNNGIPNKLARASWVYKKESVQQEILAIPDRPPKCKLRKTVTVAGQLLTCELLDEMAADQLSRVAKKKKTSKTIAAMTVAQSSEMEAVV
jgi:transposase